MKYVSKFKLFSNEIFIKDKEARENLDVVNNNLVNINNSISELENNVGDIESRLEEKYSLHYRRVITGNTYADVRGGVTVDSVEVGNHLGTTADAYESLDYFFDRLNNGETDIRYYIRKSGVYVVTKPVARNCVIHITVQADNVTIIFNTDSLIEPFCTYNSHINLKTDKGFTKCILKTPNQQNQMYFENSAILMDNVVYDGVLKMYGGYISFGNSKCGRLEMLGTSGYLNDILITNQDANNNGIWLRRGCNFIFSGAEADFVRQGASGSNNAMLKIEDSTLTLEYAQNVNSNYYYGINASSSLIFTTSGRISSFANNSNNGNTFDKCMVVTGNVGI